MNTKNILIIVGTLVVLLLVSVGVYVGITRNSSETKNQETSNTVSPFGETSTSQTGSTNNTRNQNQGDSDNPTSDSNSNNTNTNTTSDSNFAPLVQLSRERTSGIGFAKVQVTKEIEEPLEKPAANGATTTKKIITTESTRIRYVERASGHIFEYNPETKETKKISNTTIPKTEESIFVDGGSRVIMRYLGDDNQTIESYLGVLPTGSVTDKLTGGFLPENITTLTKSPDGKEIFYITKTSSGAVGNVLNIVDLKERRIFDSPYSEWLTYWGSDGITLQTKASSKYPGYAYLLKTTGGYTKITGGLLGLTSINTSENSQILIGSNTQTESGILDLVNLKTKEIKRITNLTTFPEKCTWMKEGIFLLCAAPRDTKMSSNMLDNWYKGVFFTADDLYFINTNGNTADFFADINELMKTKTELDMVNMQMSDTDEYLVFIDKKTGTPWLLNVARVSETISE